MSPWAPWRGSAHGRPVPVELYRTPSGLVAKIPRLDEVPSAWERIEGFSLFRDMRRRAGTWALTREWQVMRVLNAGDLTPAELGEMPAAVLTAIGRDELADGFVDDATVELLRSPTLSDARTLTSGYIHNAVTLAIASIAALSLVLNGARLRAAARARARELRGECRCCGYLLAQPRRTVCPECGTSA